MDWGIAVDHVLDGVYVAMGLALIWVIGGQLGTWYMEGAAIRQQARRDGTWAEFWLSNPTHTPTHTPTRDPTKQPPTQ